MRRGLANQLAEGLLSFSVLFGQFLDGALVHLGGCGSLVNLSQPALGLVALLEQGLQGSQEATQPLGLAQAPRFSQQLFNPLLG